MNEAVAKIAEILNITLKEYDRETKPQNSYTTRSGHIDSLELDQVTIESVDAMLPYLPQLGKLTLTNSTVSHISELLKLQCWSLSLLNVSFKSEAYDADILRGVELKCTPKEVFIRKMRFNVAALKDFKALKFLFLNNCHVLNIYALCQCPVLYQVDLTQVTVEETEEYEISNRREEHRFMVTLKDCTVEKRDFFRPFGAHIFSIAIYDSHLQNLDHLSLFPNLDRICIDDSTTIQDSVSGESEMKKMPEQRIRCEFKGGGKPNSLAKLASIAACFKALIIEDCNTKNLEGIELFTQVDHLRFDKSKVHLKTFLPIAQQIKSVGLFESSLKGAHLWSHFTALDTFETLSFGGNRKGLKTLNNILPLSRQIKRLDILEKLKDGENIRSFQSLEVLRMHDASFKVAQEIVSLTALKKLCIAINTKKKRKLNIGKLIHLEHFEILDSEKVRLKGFELLPKLESLELRGPLVDVNQLPLMPNLKRLYFEIDDYEVAGLAHFPNLEKLKILGAKSIKLEKLHQLKVLDLSNCIYVESFNFFEDLPNLEKLSLSDMDNDSKVDLIQFKSLRYLTNLKWLSLKETALQLLDGIEYLQNLEYLDLYKTKVRDVKILNSLKNLKEVNLAVSYQHDSPEMKHQLDRPEIAVFVWLPYVHFRIWEGVD